MSHSSDASISKFIGFSIELCSSNGVFTSITDREILVLPKLGGIFSQLEWASYKRWIFNDGQTLTTLSKKSLFSKKSIYDGQLDINSLDNVSKTFNFQIKI